MTTCIPLPFWPATLDCMTWSEDNLIAIAGAETITILVPKLKTRPTDLATWEHTTFKINSFTDRELPLLQPMSFANWSIGEEMSLRYVQSLRWSTPGLGRFNTSVLAVLHSDFAVDIWEYCGRPAAKESWRRSLMVTTAVRDYYHDHYPLTQQPQHEREEAQQVCTRIRSIAWAPATYTSDDVKNQLGQLLAVATEAGDILLVEIISPYDILLGQTQWTATVRHSISCIAHIPQLDRVVNSRLAMDDEYAVIEELIWQYAQESKQHTFTYLACGQVHSTLWRPSQPGTDAIYRQLTTSQIRVEAPLRLTPDEASILYIVGDTVMVQSLLEATKPSTILQTLQRRWSDVAGLVLLRKHDRTTAFPALHLGYHRQACQAFSLSADTTGVDGMHGVQAALLTDIENYAKKNELGGGVITHTWGIDVSPTGREGAVCCMMLPADSPAHVIQSDQECAIYLSPIESIIAANVTMSQDTTESILFALQQHISTSENDKIDRIMTEAQVSVLIARFVVSRIARDERLHQSTTTDHLKTALLGVLLQQDRLHDLQQRLLALAQCKSYGTFMPRSWYLALIDSCQRHFTTRSRLHQLSMRILDTYQIVQRKLTGNSAAASETALESCSICGNSMSFEALRWARCSAGHRFTRCALTFLAIPQAAMSKACGVCSMQYLDEGQLSELRSIDTAASDDIAVEPSNSPARILFAVFKQCILCNGHFTS